MLCRQGAAAAQPLSVNWRRHVCCHLSFGWQAGALARQAGKSQQEQAGSGAGKESLGLSGLCRLPLFATSSAAAPLTPALRLTPAALKLIPLSAAGLANKNWLILTGAAPKLNVVRKNLVMARGSFLAWAQFRGAGICHGWGKCFVLGVGGCLPKHYTCEHVSQNPEMGREADF